MIVANLATYPPRRESLLAVVACMAPQVARLNVVLNEYDNPIPELEVYENVHQIIPDVDLKDTGKFFPKVDPDDTVVLIDDDLIYPDNYVAHALAQIDKIGDARIVCGFHGSTYRKPRPSFMTRELKRWLTYDPARIAEYRDVIPFFRKRRDPYQVDQIGTGTMILRGQDMPLFSYMETSQSFVDVRIAKWCFEQDIPQVVLPKPDDWITERRQDTSIYKNFTRRNPSHVADEIRVYAYKRPACGKKYRSVTN